MHVIALLEAGGLEAAILDPFNGILHRASTALWHDADRMIEKGRAYSAQSEYRLVRGQEIPRAKHAPQATTTSKIGDVIDTSQEVPELPCELYQPPENLTPGGIPKQAQT
jgi:hypothetical protein